MTPCKFLATSALIGLGAGGVHAQSQLQLYGTLDLAVGSFASQPPGPPNAPIVKATAVRSGGAITSFFGVRGSEDLGNRMKLNFQLESFIRMDTGAYGRFGPQPSQDPFFSRSSWVGLQGDWGQVQMGNVTNPAWLANVFTSALGSNSVFSPSFRQQYNGSTRGNNALDTALPNSVAYISPRLGGLTATVAYQLKQTSLGGDTLNASLVYRNGPWLLAAAATRVRHAPGSAAPVVAEEDLFMLGGAYDFKLAKVFAQYSTLDKKLTATEHKMPHVGVTVPFGSGEFQAAWARDSASGRVNTRRTTASLGYVHHLSKRTNLYTFVSSDSLSVGTAKNYAVGVRHSF